MAKIKILVVEDERDVLLLEKMILEKEGYEVRTAMSAFEALELLKQIEFDVVISDVMMKGMDGLEFIDTMRWDPEYSARCADIPVVLVTAKATLQDFENGIATGAVVYVTKPFHHAALKAAVEMALDHKKNQDKKIEIEIDLDGELLEV